MSRIHLGQPRTFAHGAHPIPNPREEEEEVEDEDYDDYEEEPEKPETD